jgi:uncharacterized RmlC-like cupin family protein
MKIAIYASLLAGCAALAAVPIGPSGTLFENGQVKVVRALEKPHVKGKFHDHKLNRVMVYLQSGRQRFEYQDGRQPEVLNWTAGQVKWSPADGMHSPEVVSDEPFNIIEVELKNPAEGKPIDSPRDPLMIDHKHYKLEFENGQVRVWRVKVGAHDSTPLHDHTVNRVTVFLTDQDFRVTGADGKVEEAHHKAGDVIWGTPVSHSEANAGGQPFEAVVVELKR